VAEGGTGATHSLVAKLEKGLRKAHPQKTAPNTQKISPLVQFLVERKKKDWGGKGEERDEEENLKKKDTSWGRWGKGFLGSRVVWGVSLMVVGKDGDTLQSLGGGV